MAIRTCDVCGIVFQSEGHENGEWLNMCHRCNINRTTLGKGSVLWDEVKLKRLYKKLNKIGGM